MNTDIHITRSADWATPDGSEILAEEWAAVVAGDPELEPDHDNGPHAAIWTAHPEGHREAWLDWSMGNVYTQDPDAALLEKMQRIAAQLQARVVDDDNRECVSTEDLTLH